MKITMFVSNRAEQAGKPGEAQNVLRLNLPPKGDQIDDDNKDAFPDQSKKSGLVEFQGLSEEAMSAFKGGQRVTVTVEVEK